jgi:hypothetical protein
MCHASCIIHACFHSCARGCQKKVDTSYDPRQDETLLRKQVLPWYKHNDVAAGACTATRDMVMEEVYRWVSSRVLVQNGDEIVMANAETAAQSAVTVSGSSSTIALLPGGGGGGVGGSGGAGGGSGGTGGGERARTDSSMSSSSPGQLSPAGSTSSGLSTEAFMFRVASNSVLPVGSKVMAAGKGPQQRLLSFAQLTAHIVQQFGLPAFVNRQTKIRTIFDE